MVGVLVAHVVCCGGIVLVATGAVGGLGTWLLNGGATWLLVAAVVAIAILALWRRQKDKQHNKVGLASTLLNRLNTFK